MEILLVDDSRVTTLIIGDILKRKDITIKLTVINDGEKALNYLYKTGPFHNAADPDLIILDLNLPKINGLELLKDIKKDKQLKKIKVVMLTASEEEIDRYNAFKFGATDFYVKPFDYADYEKIIDRFVAVVAGKAY
ncbi:MAG: response regulator [Syntrophothermus sp.]